MKNLIIILTAILIANECVHAQMVKAVIVQLSAEQNRIQYFQRARKKRDVERVGWEANKLRKTIIRDYEDNFTYCPVYYYIDTNIDLIKRKQFDGVLLNADGSPAKKMVINSTDSEYFIVNYGYPEDNTTISTTSKGLVVYNDKFKPLHFFRIPWITEPYYTFKSRKYDIIYYPTAKLFDAHIGRVFSN